MTASQHTKEFSAPSAQAGLRLTRHARLLLAIATVVVIGAAGPAPAAEDEANDQPAAQYQALLKEFSAASRVIWHEPTDQ